MKLAIIGSEEHGKLTLTNTIQAYLAANSGHRVLIIESSTSEILDSPNDLKSQEPDKLELFIQALDPEIDLSFEMEDEKK